MAPRRKHKKTRVEPSQAFQVAQVSLGFDRAHPKVWDYFRTRNILVFALRCGSETQDWLQKLKEGLRLLVYVPQSQGGTGMVGIGQLTGGTTTFEKGGHFLENDQVGKEYRTFMRNLFSDPANEPVACTRCYHARFRLYRDKEAGQEGGSSSSPWEFGVERWGSEEAWLEKRKDTGASMVHFPVQWEVTVPFDSGLLSIDWSALNLPPFSPGYCQLSTIGHRNLTSEHWAAIRAELQRSLRASATSARSTSAKTKITMARKPAGAAKRVKLEPPVAQRDEPESGAPEEPATRKRKGSKSPARPRKVAHSWRTVTELLEDIGLNKYSKILHAEEVDLSALQLLDDRDLADLGLPLGPRRKLQAAMSHGVA